MITHPTAEELAQSVAQWLEELRPTLDPRNAFLSRVAQNALGLIARELREGADAEQRAAARLGGVLKREGSYDELVAEACRALREGEIDAQTPGLIAALKANALDQLAIDQPTYRHQAGG